MLCRARSGAACLRRGVHSLLGRSITAESRRRPDRSQESLRCAGPRGQVLRTEQLRMAANKMAYFAPDTFATRDAMLCGRLNTWLPGARPPPFPTLRSFRRAHSPKISLRLALSGSTSCEVRLAAPRLCVVVRALPCARGCSPITLRA